MGAETLVASGAAALGALLAGLILNMLRNQNVRTRDYVAEQLRRHEENRALLAAIEDRVGLINGRVRAAETHGAVDAAQLAAHAASEHELRQGGNARMDQLRHDVNELRTDMKVLLKGGAA